MSRCFPFPPPGYNKKPGPEEADALKEERQREKKHKKEKKEGKEKRDREKSDGKHKEKRNKKDKHKDKKDKHKEKRKEKEKKDRGKEKEKSSTSEVSEISGLPEARSGVKLGTKEGKEGKDDNNYLDERSCVTKFHGQNREKPVQSNLTAWETQESKYIQELGRRIRDEEKVTSNHPEKLSGTEKRDDDREIFTVRNLGNSAEGKGKNKGTEFDLRKMDEEAYREEARFTGHLVVRSPAGAANTKVSGMHALVEKNDEMMMEGKGRSKEKEEKRGDKHKVKDGDKKGHGRDKDMEKERKKEEKVKIEHNKSELGTSKNVNRGNFTGAAGNKAFHHYTEHNNANAEGNLKKRKDVEINGFLHDDETRPHKLLRPAFHPVMENGRRLGASQTPGVFASDKLGVAANRKVDNKEHRKNGVVAPQPLPVSKQKPPSATIVTDQILESKKPPHPDSKYLSQVLSVPRMDEWSDFVDQDWLLGGQDFPSRDPEVCSDGACVGPQVWSEVVHLDSADIVALPYVLPY